MAIAPTCHYESHESEFDLCFHCLRIIICYLVEDAAGTKRGFMSILIILGPRLQTAKSLMLQMHHSVAGTNGVNDGAV